VVPAAGVDEVVPAAAGASLDLVSAAAPAEVDAAAAELAEVWDAAQPVATRAMPMPSEAVSATRRRCGLSARFMRSPV
jgi:hypothetical protein